MKKVTPRIPSGFLELLPRDQLLFNQMIDKIRVTYERFGFAPIETPALELTEIILAKGGGDTDKQIYRLSKEGDDLSLHFDLTVPLARYVAQHYEDLCFPFRRYQIQKVWRGERKQKGRFREFLQCDIDVIGSDSTIVDAEIPSIIYSVFRDLGLDDFTIRINNRKILTGFLDWLGVSGLSREILRAIDKIEKQGEARVLQEIQSLGISADTLETIRRFIGIRGTNKNILQELESLGISGEVFAVGLKELKSVAEAISIFGVPQRYYKIDLAIARGLDYYTSTVYETILNRHPEVGSICSGGRYDDLAGYFTDKRLPGVGVSIGVTRLFFNLRDRGLIAASQSTPSRVVIIQAGNRVVGYSIEVAAQLRESGINTEVYFGHDKITKQFRYAGRLGVPFVIVVGDEEMQTNSVSLKNMTTGIQRTMSIREAVESIAHGLTGETGESERSS